MFGEHLSRLRDHVRLGKFPGTGVGNSDNCDISNAGVGQNQCLQLCRRNLTHGKSDVSSCTNYSVITELQLLVGCIC